MAIAGAWPAPPGLPASQTIEDGLTSDTPPVPGHVDVNGRCQGHRRSNRMDVDANDFCPVVYFTGLVVFGLDYASELGVSENGWRYG